MKTMTIKSGMTQLEAYKSVRKPFAPAVKVVQSKKSYRRPQGNFKKWMD
jgi:hypothetical protein